MAHLPSLESLRIGRDALIPVCKARVDGTPIFDIDAGSRAPIPYLCFGSSAPIGKHVEPLLAGTQVGKRLQVVYENSMAGALRVRARDGAGVAWLPRRLVQPDMEAGRLTVAGESKWSVKLEIRLHRLSANTNPLTRKIWTFLAVREGVSLVP